MRKVLIISLATLRIAAPTFAGGEFKKGIKLPLENGESSEKIEITYTLQKKGKELANWVVAGTCYVGISRDKPLPKRYGIIFGKVDAKYEKRPEVYVENGKQKKRDRWYLLSYNSKTYQLCPEEPFIHRSPFGRMKFVGRQLPIIHLRRPAKNVQKLVDEVALHAARYCGAVAFDAYTPLPYAFYVAAVTDMAFFFNKPPFRSSPLLAKSATYFGVECFGTKEERDAYAYEIAVKLGVIKPKSRTQPKGKGRGG